MLEAFEIEGLANDIYRAAGADPHQPPSVLRLVRALLGPGAVEIASTPGDATLEQDLWGQWQITVRPGQTRVRREFAVAHELIEYWLQREGYVGEDIERAATYGAACLIVPRQAFRSAWPFHGWDGLGRLAKRFSATQTCITLRAGEIFDVPVAVVCRNGFVFRRWIDADITDGALRRAARQRATAFDAPRVWRVRDASQRFGVLFESTG
jgi:hypothetical protein